MSSPATKITPVVAAVVCRGTHILIVRRGPGQSGAGWWEFPGGKIEDGESHQEALVREIAEELGIRIQVKDFIGQEVYSYPQKTIQLFLYYAESPDEQLVLTEHDAFSWVEPRKLEVTLLSEADRPFVTHIRKHFAGLYGSK